MFFRRLLLLWLFVGGGAAGEETIESVFSNLPFCPDSAQLELYYLVDSEDSCASQYFVCRPNRTSADELFCGTDQAFLMSTGKCAEDGFEECENPSRLNCTGLPNGDYPDGGAPCRPFFFTCLDGESYPRACPGVKLRYDGTSRSCLFAPHISGCGGVATTTTTTTTSTAATTLSTEPQEIDCSGKEGHFADPFEPCADHFIVCTGGQKIVFLCAQGTYYDSEVGSCDIPVNIPSCSGRLRTTGAPGGSVLPPSLEINCTNRVGDHFHDPENNCSRRFFTCSRSGDALEMFCPGDDTYYDIELNQCLFFHQVPECTGVPRPPTSPPTTTTPPPFDCSFRADGNYGAPGESCATYFYQCANGRAFRFECPFADSVYDRGSNQCLGKTMVSGCGRRKKRSVEDAEGSDELDPPSCRGRIDGFYKLPSECHRFLLCVSGESFILNCPPSYVFNARKNRCGIPSAVERPCGVSDQDVELDCANKSDDRFHATPLDCRLHFRCAGGRVAAVKSCREGLAFHPDLEACVPAVDVPGCSPPPTLPTDLTNFCLKSGPGLYRHPENCRRAVACMGEVAVLFACSLPHRPAFNSISKTCEASVPDCSD